LRENPVAGTTARTDPEPMTAIALQIPPSDQWAAVDPVELGDSTWAYVHVMRVEHQLRAAELRDAIARAERWLGARERELAAAGARARSTGQVLRAPS
jgi:hypothetical protein